MSSSIFSWDILLVGVIEELLLALHDISMNGASDNGKGNSVSASATYKTESKENYPSDVLLNNTIGDILKVYLA